MKKIILYMFLVWLMLPLGVSAQETLVSNPFIPQLPKRPEPVEEIAGLNSQNDEEKALMQRRRDSLMGEDGISGEEEKVKEIVLPILKISGLVWNTTRPQAIVNERVVDVGDNLVVGESADNVKIVSIEKTGLEVEYMGKSFTVSP